MDTEPTFRERKKSDIKLGMHNTKNEKEIMDFMEKEVVEIREHYARKREELYEDEGYLIALLISEFNIRKNQIY